MKTIEDVEKDIRENANLRSVEFFRTQGNYVEVRYMRYRDAKDKGSLHFVVLSKDEAQELRKRLEGDCEKKEMKVKEYTLVK